MTFAGAAINDDNWLRGKVSLQHEIVVNIEQFRNREAKSLALNTANLSLKVLRVCFADAERQRLIESNPAKIVDFIESREESKRRAFTLREIQRILEHVSTTLNGAALSCSVCMSANDSVIWLA